MQSDWDRSAGWVLAWMNIKPQLTIILLIAILLWCARQRRTRVIEGFVTGLVLLLAVSTWLVPTWPRDMFRSSSETPLVTVDYPWVGTTWLLVLRSIGLGGWILWAGYLAAVLPLGWLVLRTAMDRTSALSDVFALSILVAYFVAPYARLYDMGVLVIPLLVLISGRLHQAWTGALLLTVVALPYLQFIYGQPPGNFAPHVRFFWIPLLIAATWLATRTRLSNVRV